MEHIELGGHERERVAVGTGEGAAGVSRHPGAAGGVDDIHRHVQFAFEQRGHVPCDAVRAAARRPRTEQHQRLAGEGCAARATREDGGQRQRRGKDNVRNAVRGQRRLPLAVGDY